MILPENLAPASDVYSFGKGNTEFPSPGAIKIKVEAAGQRSALPVGIYLYHQGTWRYLETVMKEDGFAEARTPSLGTFILARGEHQDPLTRYEAIVKEYSLSQNYPNPFNPVTSIQYAIPSASRVTLRVYNILGQEVVTLVNQHQEAGRYSVIWDTRDHLGREVSTGIYLYSLTASSFHATRKMVVIK